MIVEKKEPRRGTVASVYISAENKNVHDEIKDLAKRRGVSESEVTLLAWKDLIHKNKEVAPAFFEPLSILVIADGVPVKRTFVGRWIFSPEKPFVSKEVEFVASEYDQHPVESFRAAYFAVALTAKGNWVILRWDVDQAQSDAHIDSFSSWNDLVRQIPPDLASELAKRGDFVREEEWDV